MRWRGTERTAAIILGAGATRGAAGLVRVNGKRLAAPLNADFFTIAEKFANSANSASRERFRRLKSFFAQGFSVRGRWPLPMEEAFSLLYASKDFPAIYKTGRGPHTQRFREIEDFLRLTAGLLSAVERAVGDGRNRYDGLVSVLGGKDCLISLNYDTMLDSSLVRGGWRPEVGYSLSVGKGKFAWAATPPPKSQRLAAVRLLKLHGSSNWYVKASNKGAVERVFAARPSKVTINICPGLNEPAGLLRQVVPPIYGKFFAHTHWEALWQKAHAALTTSELLVVVGCSLQPSDFHLWGMVRHAALARKKNGNPWSEAILVDRKASRQRWRGLLGGCASEFKTDYASFERFLDCSELKGG
jgi:hypothetical protein